MSVITASPAMSYYPLFMPTGLTRYYGTADLHFITCSCYRRQPWLGTARRRDLFLRILEETRTRYRFVVLAYVVMPEHFHLLLCEPQIGDPSKIMQVVKQRFAQRLVSLWRTMRKLEQPAPWPSHPFHIWQPRFYDFNVWTERKRIEKVRYIHRNPVTRGLVRSPGDWRWSSFRYYMFGEIGAVRVNQTDLLAMHVCPPAI
ncbi:MAG TPA: transposase [Terriglobales bacterium]|nr:transposase [Terriglobales bacterium]